MTKIEAPAAKPKRISGSFPEAVVSVLLECLLIIMLFINSIFSFLITKYARFWKLDTPCLFCSRLDHVLSREKKGFYWDLICGDHKYEVSSLVLCDVHNKLVDVHRMCEGCLFSFTTISKSNLEIYRLLVGKLGEDSYLGSVEDPLRGAHKLISSSQKRCACCNQPGISRGYAQNLLRTRLVGSEASDLNFPISNTKGSVNEVSVLPKSIDLKNEKVDPLSHRGYTELKLTSDTESEVPFSDGDASSLVRETISPKENLTVRDVPIEHRLISPSEDLNLEKKPIDMASESLLGSQQLNDLQLHGSKSVPSNEIEELNGQKDESKADPSAETGLMCVDEPLYSNAKETFADAFEGNLIRSTEAGTPVQAVTSKVFLKPLRTSQRALHSKSVSCDAHQLGSSSMDPGDMYKPAVVHKGRKLSAEQFFSKESPRLKEEDLKLLFSQIASTRAIPDQSMNKMSPQLSMMGDEFKTSSISNTVGMEILNKRMISLERNESNLSIDGSLVSEIEGESTVDQLKRQVEHDKKLMSGLYRELEEERNASTIAANQALAMITRLQEEKATLHMEALQCLRMMEEQSEYDNEALERANDYIAEKEKEIQDLEAELEYHRNIEYPNNKLENFEDSASVTRKANSCEKLEGDKNMGTLVLNFDKERSDIIKCLENLEKILYPLSDNKADLKLDNNENSRSEGDVLGGDLKNGGRLSLLENTQSNIKENGELDHSRVFARMTNLALLSDDISSLNKRLETLEADCDFLELTINSLGNGEEGLQLIREIACHLQELRRIEMRRDQTVV